MELDFSVDQGICLVQPPHDLDLHNDLDFQRLEYSVALRRVVLEWKRGSGEWIKAGTPESVRIEFRDATGFHFQPRDPEMPLTEDDCLAVLGWWVDDEWCSGAMMLDSGVAPDPEWLLAFEFQSGAIAAAYATAIVGVQAEPA